MNIFITGGHGFLGTHVVKELQKIVTPTDKLYIPNSKELNLFDYSKMETFFQTYNIDVVIHLAAKMAGIGELTAKPCFYLESNLMMNYNIVKLAYKYHVKKFITLGSSCAYNNNTPLPMEEKEFWKKKPENTYGICKLILLEHLKSQNNMDWVYFVPGNIYGPGDHFDEENAHLIPATVRKIESALKKKQKQIEVWGDGSQVRDFIYVKDVAELIVQAITNSDYSKQAINLSGDNSYTVKEIVEMLLEGMQAKEIKPQWAVDKPTGIEKKLLDNSKFKKINPEYTFMPMKEGIFEMLEWYYITKGIVNYRK